MKSKRFGYWTEKRLDGLVAIFEITPPAELKRIYKRPFFQIVQAYEFRIQSLSMHAETTKVDGVKITCYNAGYAYGTTIQFGNGGKDKALQSSEIEAK